MEKLQARMLIEILGKPKENVASAMHGLIEKLATEKGVVILERNIREPVELKESKELFTTFADIVVEFDSVSTYLLISFAYLPSNIEIISPEKVTITNHELSFLGTKIIQRIHEYDAIVKKTLMERDMLIRRLQEFAPHLFVNNPTQVPQVVAKKEAGQKKKQPKKRKPSKKVKK